MSWQDDAACRAEPTELFFPMRGDMDSVKAAKAVCARCAVRIDCLEYALDARETIGIWGGLSERERRKVRRRRLPKDWPHGTHQRYRHQNCRCDACRLAWARYCVEHERTA